MAIPCEEASTLLNDVLDLLAARRDGMLDLDHLVRLSRTVARCGRASGLEIKTADLLTEPDIDAAMRDEDLRWDLSRDGELADAS